jgi:murein DD-endopeptidase MepM/ murein hydrolase activator NlpD
LNQAALLDRAICAWFVIRHGGAAFVIQVHVWGEPHLRNLRVLRIVFFLVCLSSCRELGLVEGTPRERYERALSRAYLANTALGAQWFEAGRNALAMPVRVSLPFRETGYFPAERTLAAGFEFLVPRGQRMMVHLAVGSSEPAQVFLDLYRLADSNRAPEHLLSADSGETGLDVEIEESGTYLLRIQPELLRAVRYTITIRTTPSLGFPVEGAGNEAIRSRYGMDRDGGRRRHEGIDIFAPRGTPVLAAAPGRIVNVGESGLGGLVVWLHDEQRNQNLYYAHLDRQLAREGESVNQGDTLGFVGNTGNARTTQPHLHFGIYRRGEGAIDPYPFVWRSPAKIPTMEADSGRLGEWMRVSGRRAVLTGGRFPADTMARSTVMRVIGVSGASYRVELPDTRTGYIVERAVQPVANPTRYSVLDTSTRVLERPVPGAVVAEILEPGMRIGVLGEFGEYQMIRTAGGGTGWVRR